MSKAFTLDSTYVNLRPDDSATTLKIGPRFWATIAKRTDLGDGRLMGCTPQRKDCSSGSAILRGEEILILLSGELDMVFETGSGARKRRLKAGQTLVVPRNTWHRGAGEEARQADVHHARCGHRAPPHP